MQIRKTGIAVLTALSIGTSGVIVPNAIAAEINETITKLTYLGTPSPGETLRAEIEWEVPDTAQPGDTFKVELPSEFSTVRTSFNLADKDGNVIATAAASGGSVVFTLAEGARGKINRKGDAFFAVKVSKDAEPEMIQSTKYGQDLSKTVDLKIQEKAPGPEKFQRTYPYKGGTFKVETIDGEEKGVVDWYVNSANKTLAALDGVKYESVKTTFVDQAQDGQRIDCNETSVALATLDVEGGTGKVLKSTPVTPTSFTCSEREVRAVVEGVGEDQMAILYVRTIVDYGDQSLGLRDGFAQVKNDATVTIGEGGEAQSASSQVRLEDAGGTGSGDNPPTPPTTEEETPPTTEEETPPTTEEETPPTTKEETPPTTKEETPPTTKEGEPCDCTPSTVVTTKVVEKPVTRTETVEVVKTVTQTPAPVTTTKVVNQTETVTITKTPEPVVATVTESKEVEVTKTETVTSVVTSVIEPTPTEPSRKPKEPAPSSSDGTLERCIANAAGSPILWLLPVAILGQVGGDLAAPYLGEFQAQLNQINAQAQQRFADEAARRSQDNPLGQLGNDAARRANEVASQFHNQELAAQINKANLQFQTALNSPEAKQLGYIIGGIAAVTAAAGLAYDWCTNENGEALTSFGSSRI